MTISQMDMFPKQSKRGGSRAGAGRKAGEKTVRMRVPERLLEIVEKLCNPNEEAFSMAALNIYLKENFEFKTYGVLDKKPETASEDDDYYATDGKTVFRAGKDDPYYHAVRADILRYIESEGKSKHFKAWFTENLEPKVFYDWKS